MPLLRVEKPPNIVEDNNGDPPELQGCHLINNISKVIAPRSFPNVMQSTARTSPPFHHIMPTMYTMQIQGKWRNADS
eukprot:11520993-Ditylum_brightwellii.AAC.1